MDDGNDDPYVAILSQGTSGKSITPSLAMFAGDSGSITSNTFRIKRSGVGTATSYALIPLMKSDPVDVEGYDLFDLEKVCVRHIAYADQKAFYGFEADDEAPAEVAAPSMEW